LIQIIRGNTHAAKKKQEERCTTLSRNASNGHPHRVSLLCDLEHFRRVSEGEDPSEVARKLNIAFQEEPQSLINSLGCFVLRVCGLGGAVGKVEFEDVSASIAAILELVDEKHLESAA
jgi:hypothetical protein